MIRKVDACLLSFFLICTNLIQAQSPAAQEHQQQADLGNGYYQNAILPGDYPDPSVLRVGDDYYMTHSSFEYYPGLRIWHSKDLVNWEPVTHALHKYVGSVWAPDLVKFKDRYYIYFPASRKNWVVSAASPAGPWTDPVELKVDGIDPGHIVGKDGKRYLYMSGGNIAPLSDDGLAITGEIRKVYNGWPIPDSLGVECFCLESPKLSYHNGYFYQTVAEGGTSGPATSHMVISARSKKVDGPWENSPYNPIIHTQSQDEKWWSKGHGTIVEDPKGGTWMMYHAYEKDFHTLGRQTLLQPLEWTADGWFKEPAGFVASAPVKMPPGKKVPHGLRISDDFSGDSLGLQWQFYKDNNPARISLKNGSLFLEAKGKNLPESSPILVTAANHAYTLTAELKVPEGVTAGITLFYDEAANCGVAIDHNNVYVIRQQRTYRFERKEKGPHAFVKLEIRNNDVFFYCSADGQHWQRADKSLGVSGFNHNTFGGFLSLRPGVFAFGTGTARFDSFMYSGN